MKFIIGYIMIIVGIAGLLVNGYLLIGYQKTKKIIKKNLGRDGEEVAAVNSFFTPYYGVFLIVSLCALLIGIYIASNKVTNSQAFGILFLLFSLSAFVQSFRKASTQSQLYEQGNYGVSVERMAWRLRAMAAISFAIGIYLFV